MAVLREAARALFFRRAMDRETAEELQFHLDQETELLRQTGLDAAQAERVARIRFGGTAQHAESVRDARPARWLDELWRDCRYACRSFVRAPGFTLVAVVTLSLGIGANTALFSAVNGLLIRKLPVSDPDSLVRLRRAGDEMATSTSEYGYSRDLNGVLVGTTFSYPTFQDLLAANQTLSALLACAPYGRVNVIVDGVADTAEAFLSTGNFFSVLGVNAAIGRTLVPDDDTPDAPPVAAVSHGYWLARFGGDPQVVGRVVRINNVAVTIVGVLPQAFTGVQRPVEDPADVWLPLALDARISPPSRPARMGQATYSWLQVMGRLKPSVTPEQVEGNLNGVFQSSVKGGIDAYFVAAGEAERARFFEDQREVPRLIVDSGSRGVHEASPTENVSVSLLSAVAGLVLLLVCANVANLLLSRATTRHQELAVRRSLGATRARLVRQLLTESLLLAGMGGALGIAIGYAAQPLLPGATGDLAALDWNLVWFTLALTCLTGVVFGIAPALRASRNLSARLHEGGRGVVASQTRLGRTLLIVQVAASLVLLVGAGLFLRTVQNLRQVDVGFESSNIVLFRLSPQLNGYDLPRAASLFDQVTARLSALPGVRSVGFSNAALLSGSVSRTSVAVDRPGGQERISTHYIVASAAFLETMEIPLVAGRGITDSDDLASPRVAVINESAAALFFPGADPIGQRYRTDAVNVEIVGVVRDAKYSSLRDPAPPTIFVPARQRPISSAQFEVRTAGDPAAAIPAVRAAVREVDPTLPLWDVSTQWAEVEERLNQERTFAQALSLFGALALVVASVGLFGLMSYSVARRRNEIGLRMALGAQPEAMMSLVMRESMVLVAIGVAVGLAGAAGASRLVTSQLFDVTTVDPVSYVGAAAVLGIVSAIAAALPARRASRIDPAIALRAE